MSLLLRAAVLGGIAYLITRSMSGGSTSRRAMRSGREDPIREVDSDASHVWPTSDDRQPASANTGPSS
jgi:hypothetical protein